VTEPAPLRVGFAGLGRMGTPMARRVLEAGFPLTVWNRSPERCEALTSLGAEATETPRELAERSELVLTMVADADALRAVLLGDDGALAGLRAGSILSHPSTIGRGAAVVPAAAVAERGAQWIDSPVSGSTAVAERGELTLLLGGEPSAIERAEPVLAAFSQKRFHLGTAGAGAAMKLAVNTIVAVLNEAVAEGLVLAERAGITREAAYEVFAAGAVAAPYVQYKRDAFLRPDGAPVMFTVEMMRKDLRLVFDLAGRLGVELAAARAADGVLERAGEHGLAEADFARVAQVIREPRGR
jgi:3-hydroxyisobutyrate dehydrogenase-like beta-hydroxyacid dehydrogenase